MINEVLDLSKIEAGKQELRVEVFSLPALLTEVTDAQETRAHAKGLGLRRPDPTALPESVVTFVAAAFGKSDAQQRAGQYRTVIELRVGAGIVRRQRLAY